MKTTPNVQPNKQTKKGFKMYNTLYITRDERKALIESTFPWLNDGFAPKIYGSVERADGTYLKFSAEKWRRDYCHTSLHVVSADGEFLDGATKSYTNSFVNSMLTAYSKS